MSWLLGSLNAHKQLMQNLHIVVTGASGLCGRRMVTMLLERGVRLVTAFDRVKHEVDDSRVRSVVGDIADKDAVAAAVEGADAVIHLAALVGVRLWICFCSFLFLFLFVFFFFFFFLSFFKSRVFL